MNVLVVGGYGLIGRQIVSELTTQGFTVTGMGRSTHKGQQIFPDIKWLSGDLHKLCTPEDWETYLSGIDAVVNASGALQSGLRDNLQAIQSDAIRALISACEQAGIKRFVQISAPGAEPDDASEFLRTKSEADSALRASTLNWVILKPGLVISSEAYGGTMLLRSLAAFPIVQPSILTNAEIYTVPAKAVGLAVIRSLKDPKLHGGDFDLVEQSSHTLQSVILEFRQWLGFSKPAFVLPLPIWVGTITARLADITGWFGWRSPLRSTAMSILKQGIKADPGPWEKATGEKLASLSQTFATMPATSQERLFARMQLLFPVIAITLAFFWLASGLIGFAQQEAAAMLVTPTLGKTNALLSVIAGSIIDCLIGVALLFRQTFTKGCLAAIIVSVGYLVLGTFLTPEFWLDPLGPLIKIFPGILLAATGLAIAQER